MSGLPETEERLEGSRHDVRQYQKEYQMHMFSGAELLPQWEEGGTRQNLLFDEEVETKGSACDGEWGRNERDLAECFGGYQRGRRHSRYQYDARSTRDIICSR